MRYEVYEEMCHHLNIKPTKKSWHAYLRQALIDLKRIMKEAGVTP